MKRQHEKLPLVPESETTRTTTPIPLLRSLANVCHALVLILLTAAVIVLFVQVQWLNYALDEQKQQMSKLIGQSTKVDELSQQVATERSYIVYQLAGTFTLLTALITLFHILSHLRHFTVPSVQRKIVAILWLSPIYSLTSFLGLVWPPCDGYVAVLRDFYEAYAVYNFLSFLVAVLGRGDRTVVVERLAKHEHLNPPISRWCRSSNNDDKAKRVLLECQLLCMQFVFCRPMTSIASFVVTTLNAPSSNAEQQSSRWSYFASPAFFIAMITNLSVFLAFFGLLQFYHAVRNELQFCQPFAKFLSIKGIVFLTFWQGLTISILVNLRQDDDGGSSSSDQSSSVTTSPREQSIHIQNVLICLEMLMFAIAHWWVFPYEEWQENYRRSELGNLGFGFFDFASDVQSILQESSRSSLPNETETSSGDEGTTNRCGKKSTYQTILFE